MNMTLYSYGPQTATIAASPSGMEEHGRPRHRHKNRHRRAPLHHWRGQPPRGPESVCPALLGNRVSQDRKSTRLNSSHTVISYAVFCLKKKKKKRYYTTDDTSIYITYTL